MKILNTKTLKNGKTHVLIEIDKGELPPEMPNVPGAFYKLNYPMDDTIVEGYIMRNPQRMHWDSYAQKWVEA